MSTLTLVSTYPKQVPKATHCFWGYYPCEDDPSYQDPIPEALDELKYVLPYINDQSISLRKAASHLTESAGISITHAGLRGILKRRKHPIFDRLGSES